MEKMLRTGRTQRKPISRSPAKKESSPIKQQRSTSVVKVAPTPVPSKPESIDMYLIQRRQTGMQTVESIVKLGGAAPRVINFDSNPEFKLAYKE